MAQQGAQMKTMSAHKLFFAGFLTLSTIFMYLCYQSELHHFLLEKGNTRGSLRSEVQAPLTQVQGNSDGLSEHFRFVIKVLAYDRLESVSRCLRSLASADYVNDRVKLHILVDHFRIEEQWTREDSAAVDGKLKNAHQILQYVDRFEWKHGEKEIHYRTQNAGLQAQWLEAWWPSSDHEFAFIVEDDMELSPLFYRYLRNLIAKYYYDPSNFNPSIYGASLQRPRFVAGKHGNKLKVDDNTRLFLYQIVGTWGQLLFPKPWKEFRLWYDVHKSKGIKPMLQGMVTTGWYKRMGEKIWTPWFIKFIQSRGYFNMYTNFLLERALSVSYRDAGVNYGKKAGPDSHLINSSGILDINIWEMKPLESLNWYDLCFREIFPGRFVKRLDEMESVMSTVHEQKRVILVNVLEIPDAVVRNLLCQFQKLDIRGYILLGSKQMLLQDLARRGHPVMDAERLSDDMKTLGLVDHKAFRLQKMRESLVTAYVVKKLLQLGYRIWLLMGNTFPTEDLFSVLIDHKFDVIGVGTEKYLRTELLYLKNSVVVLELWNKVLEELTLITKPFSVDEPPAGDDILSFCIRRSIGGFNVRIKLIDGSLIEQVKSNTSHTSDETLEERRAKLAFWVPKGDTDYIKEHLEALNLWIVDDEFACTSVVCHKT